MSPPWRDQVRRFASLAAAEAVPVCVAAEFQAAIASVRMVGVQVPPRTQAWRRRQQSADPLPGRAL
jgi:hypothetical protein